MALRLGVKLKARWYNTTGNHHFTLLSMALFLLRMPISSILCRNFITATKRGLQGSAWASNISSQALRPTRPYTRLGWARALRQI